MADFLGTLHTEFTFTVEEGIDALYDLIWHIESYEQVQGGGAAGGGGGHLHFACVRLVMVAARARQQQPSPAPPPPCPPSASQVRAAVPMYLLSQRIKAMGMKVVLSGEGADEIFGGYLYFHKAPSPGGWGGWGPVVSAVGLWVGQEGAAGGWRRGWPPRPTPPLPATSPPTHPTSPPPPPPPLPADEYHKECVRLVTRLHQWDVLRANKAPFAFGLETRVPFLDKQFLQVPGVGVWCVVLCGCVVGQGRAARAATLASCRLRHARVRVLAHCPLTTPPSHPVPPPPTPPPTHPPTHPPTLCAQVSMNIDARDKMPNLAEKPDGVHPKLEKYILRKVWGVVRGCCTRLAQTGGRWAGRQHFVRRRCRAQRLASHPALSALPTFPLPPHLRRRLTRRSSPTCLTRFCSARRSSSLMVWATTGWMGSRPTPPRCAGAVGGVGVGGSEIPAHAVKPDASPRPCSPAAPPLVRSALHPAPHLHPALPQVVTDDMWESRFERFPVHPPRTREYFLLRSIFETHFPHPDAIKTVPQVHRCGGCESVW